MVVFSACTARHYQWNAYDLGVRFLVVDIGGSKTALGVVDNGALTEHQSWQHAGESDAAVVRSMLAEQLTQLNGPVAACGVSFGGSFDFMEQTCGRSFHVTGWESFPLNAWLSEVVQAPVLCDNDANVAALGEYERLAGENIDSLMYVTLSTGVGSAFTLNGAIWRGAHSLAGEFGHLDVGHSNLCSCGQTGCLERAVSGYWLQRDLDEPAAAILENEERFLDWTDVLAQGLWAAVTLIDPAVIVLGGGMVVQGDRLQSRLQQLLGGRAALANRPGPRVELGDSTGRSVLIGAGLLAKEALA